MLTAGNPSLQRLDLNHDGNLTDDERDADADGLSNIVEYSFTGTQNWWSKGPYKDEKPYSWRTFADPSPINPDSDGDGVLDGADDQDVDGYDNYTEMELARWGSGLVRQPVQPVPAGSRTRSPAAATCRWTATSTRRSTSTHYDKWVGSAVPLTLDQRPELRSAGCHVGPDLLERRPGRAGPGREHHRAVAGGESRAVPA